jgi:hypothetical protein
MEWEQFSNAAKYVWPYLLTFRETLFRGRGPRGAAALQMCIDFIAIKLFYSNFVT